MTSVAAANGGRLGAWAAWHWQDHLRAYSVEMPGGSARAQQIRMGREGGGLRAGHGSEPSLHALLFSHDSKTL